MHGLLPGPPAAASLASCSLARPDPQSATSLGPPAAALLCVLSARLPVSAPPTGLGECVFFISLVVRLPYSLIFCQFWLFFVFKLLLSFVWLCEEAQCVYLCLPLGQKSPNLSLQNLSHSGCDFAVIVLNFFPYIITKIPLNLLTRCSVKV